MRIELIERPDRGPCFARVFVDDPWCQDGKLVFLSPCCGSREMAIEKAEEWARENFGHELPVLTEVEELPWNGGFLNRDDDFEPKRGRDPSYGSRPLPVTNKDAFDEYFG